MYGTGAGNHRGRPPFQQQRVPIGDLDFNDEAAIRWWLLPNKRTIVIDPTVAFGQPTIAGYGTRTSTIADAMRAEESIDKVARLYEIDRKSVRDALAFESRNSATATA